MTDTSRTRVHYFERQFLGAQDFEAEQQYHLAMRRRHNIAQHRWGIVVGLELGRDDDGSLWVLPGMAIDGYGRELILAERQQLATGEFAAKDSDTLDVWIEYERLGSDTRSQRMRGCDADDGLSFYRWQEQPRIRLTRPDPNAPDRRKPGTVPDGDQDFAPFRAPPDDPRQDWPVFLGQIMREQQQPNQPYTYGFSLADRPYVGLVGSEIVAPSGRARVQLGGKTPDERRQFAIFVGDLPQPPLEIDSDGAVTIGGATTVEGNLTIKDGAIEFQASAVEDPPTAPAVAHLWQMYHVIEKLPTKPDTQPPAAQKQSMSPPDTSQAGATGGDAATAKKNLPQISDELRIEIPAGEAKGASRFVIGGWSADDKEFKPYLSVAGDGQVTVHGDLIVNGLLDEAEQRPTAPISQRAQDLILASTIGAAGTAIGTAMARSQNESDPEVLDRVLTTDAGRMSVIKTLVENDLPDPFNVFVDQLLKQAMNRVLVRLLGADTNITPLVQNVLASPALGRVVGELVADDRAAQPLMQKLLEQANGARLAVVLEGALKDAAARAAIVTILHDETIRTAFVPVLLTDVLVRSAIIATLPADEDTYKALAGLLLADELGRNVSITILHDKTIREAFIPVLLADELCRGTVIELLPQDPQALAERVLKLTTTQLETFVDGLLADTTGKRNSIIKQVEQNSESRQIAADTLADTQRGRKSIASALLKQLAGNDEKIQEFAKFLKENPAVASKLRAELPEGT
jgi:hypothetical protein